MRQRYYDQNTGRFTRRDSYEGRFEEPLTLHRYLYTHNNPVNFTDPTGLLTWREGFAVSAILATIYYVTWRHDHWSRSNSVSKNGEEFETSDQAAIAAIREINPRSIIEGIEYAGRICKSLTTGKYFYTEAYPGQRTTSRPGFCPALSIPQGYYHTHGDDAGPEDSEIPSREDFALASRYWFSNEGYVGTPKGWILKFNSSGVTQVLIPGQR